MTDGPGWDQYLSEQDRAVAELSGYGARGGLGTRPVVLVIDVNVAFCGDRPEPILESVRRWRNSCGERAWEAVGRIARLLEAARARRVPVIYSTGVDPRPDRFDAGRWAGKNRRRGEDVAGGNEIVAPIAPHSAELVVRKAKPSVLFGTTLAAWLVDLRADTIIACGATTSGCVRATVVDAFSLNYRVGLVADCTFDRFEASHHVNLFDLQQKYADVIDLEAAERYLATVPAGLYDDRLPPPPQGA